MRRFTVAERRARLGVRHRLAARAETAPRWRAPWSRCTARTPPRCTCRRGAHALPRHRGHRAGDVRRPPLMRMLCMRRTVFTVPAELAPVVAGGLHQRRRAARTPPYAAVPRPGRRGGRRVAARGRGGHGERACGRAARRSRRAVRRRAAAEDGSCSPRATKYEACAGRHERGCCSAWPPRAGSSAAGRAGSWISSQFRWSPMESWLPGGHPRGAGRRGAGRAGTPLARGVRPGHRRRPQVVDRLDAHPGQRRR